MLATNPVTANLIKARELIADESKWTTPDKPTFCERGHYCAEHALSFAMGGNADGYAYNSVERDCLIRAARAQGKIDPSAVNDVLGHAAVMQMFNRAIELSLQEGA